MDKYDGMVQSFVDSKNSCSRIYQMLADDESRDTYLNRLNFLISGNLKYIRKIIRKYNPAFDFPTPADLRRAFAKAAPPGGLCYMRSAASKILSRTWRERT